LVYLKELTDIATIAVSDISSAGAVYLKELTDIATIAVSDISSADADVFMHSGKDTIRSNS